ncbi:MAG: molybdenum ABC transporter ATP-binding protein [Acidobacteriota bacterium]
MLRVLLSKSFGLPSEPSFSLDLSFEAGLGCTILFGASGSGKTLTLQLIAGIQIPDSGTIHLDGECFFDSSIALNLPIRERRIGYVFQDLALFPHLTVIQNIEYGLRGVAKGERKERTARILEDLHISGLASRKPVDLSGGERQRVAFARAVVTRPRLLLLDEPLSALDLAIKRWILADLRRVTQQMGIPVLYVTHDRMEALTLGNFLLLFEKGRVVASGQPIDVLERPHRETTAVLLGVENLFDGKVLRLEPERGTLCCDVGGRELEIPFAQAMPGQQLRIGLRAGDILIATQRPNGLSAQNVVEGTIHSLEDQDGEVHVTVDCGIFFKVHVTRNAETSLHLRAGERVWLVFKAHSCHILS